MALVVIIPASNEEAWIERCLGALVAQREAPPLHVIVSANACRDRTAALTRAMAPAFAAAGHALVCLDSPEPGKLAALNRAEAAIPEALGDAPRAFLDADVLCGPALLGQIAEALSVPAPRYATGTLEVARARSAFTRAYAAVWTRLPFVTSGAVGAGFFAVNAAGRARWGVFPDIIADDTLARVHFAPAERIEVPARYVWPMIEGFRPMVRVRRRQDEGVREVAAMHPELMANEAKPRLGLAEALRIVVAHPFGALAYLLVHVAVRLGRSEERWGRGR